MKSGRNQHIYGAEFRNKMNKDIHISSDRRADNSYIVTYKDKIVKRIYMLQNDGWYIWDEKLGFRTPVESFTKALKLVEEEIVRCVA